MRAPDSFVIHPVAGSSMGESGRDLEEVSVTQTALDDGESTFLIYLHAKHFAPGVRISVF